MLAGAKMAAEAVLVDLGMQIPWSGWEEVVNDKGVRQGKGTRAIDRVQTTGCWSYFQGALLALVILVIGMWCQVFDRFPVAPLSS